MKKRNIQIYIDGAKLDEIKNFKEYDGFTFNPSLFKKLGAKDYLTFTKEIINETKDKPLSIEVFADDEDSCFKQAKIISKLSNFIYVKIPITYTNGKTTKNLIKRLAGEDIKLNITAIFTLNQIKEIISEVQSSDHILSIFSGRLYDIGLDAGEIFKTISNFVHENSKCETLWASCRMAYDLITAEKSNADIITMSPSLAKKVKNFGKTPEEFSLDTVKTFYNDAKDSGFKF